MPCIVSENSGGQYTRLFFFLLGRARLFIVGEERGCLQNIEESALSVEDSAGKVMCIRSWTLGRIVEIRNWRLPRNVSRIASNHLLILILDP